MPAATIFKPRDSAPNRTNIDSGGVKRMDFVKAKNEYLDYIRYEKRYSKTTFTTYQCWLNHFIRWLEAEGYPNPDVYEVLSLEVLRRYLRRISRDKRPRTVRGAFHPIRGIIAYLIEEGVLEANPIASLRLPKKDAAVREQIRDSEVYAVLDAADNYLDQTKSALVKAVIATLIYTGIRAREICDLKVNDVNFEAQTLLITRGKGNKSRMLFPHPDYWPYIKEWMIAREKWQLTHEYMFTSTRCRRMSDEQLRKYVEECKAMAGLREADAIKPHGFRHWFAKNYQNNGGPVTDIQVALGHSAPTTTFIYLKAEEDAAKSMRDLAFLSRPKPEPKKSTSGSRTTIPSNKPVALRDREPSSTHSRKSIRI